MGIEKCEIGAKPRVVDKEPSWRLYEERKLMMESCACTYLTAKAFSMLDQEKKFVGCDLDQGRWRAVEPDLVSTAASQVRKEMKKRQRQREVSMK